MENFEFEEKLVLIDGNSLINRAFFALPPLTDTQGNYTHAVYGFTTMLLKAINDYKPKYIAVCFDLAHPTFRHLMYTDYKATRKKMPQDLASQMPMLKDLLKCMDIETLELKGYEADDLIGTISKKSGIETIILTGDRDTLQLIDERIKVYLTKKGLSEIEEVDLDRLKNEYGLTPDQVIDFKALMGDASDNIPGVSGVGEKTALRLITDYKTLNGVYEHIDEMTGKLREKLEVGKQSAYMSYELATIEKDVPIEFDLKDFEYTYPFAACIRDEFEKLKFKSLLKKDIFSDSVEELIVESFGQADITEIKTEQDLTKLDLKKPISIVWDKDINIAADCHNEYKIIIADNLLGDGLPFETVVNYLKPYLENLDIIKTVFDYKNMRHYLSGVGINLQGVFDVQLAGYVVDGGVGITVFKKFLDRYDCDETVPAVSLNIIKQRLDKELKNFEHLFYEIEMPLADVLYDMECIGFKLDISVLDELNQKYNADLKQLTQKIWELAREEFNINSPKQLGEILYNKLNLSPTKSTKTTKAHSTDAQTLEKLKGKHEIIDYILRYRTVAKLNSTYIEGLKKVADSDGVVHTVFRQALTSTGRLSSIEPNLQNIPIRDQEGREIRRAFVAREGYKLVTADYSQIELRLLAHYSGEPKLIESYRNNEDIHTRTASEVFGVPKDQVTKAMRRDAKAVNFGIIYGISDFGLAKGLDISVSQAHSYIEKYFFNYPKVKEYMRLCVEKAKKNAEVVLSSGRVRKIPELKSPSRTVRAFGERAAMNMPLQGTAADLIKIAMINVSKELKKQNLKSRLILQVHDELMVEAKTEEVDKVAQILKTNMENAMKFDVPILVEIGIGDNWFEI